MEEFVREGGPGRDSALRAVLEGLPDAVVATRADGRIDFVNARAGELFGYAPEELVGQPVAQQKPTPAKDEKGEAIHPMKAQESSGKQ